MVRYHSPYILTESGLELGRTPTISKSSSTNKAINWNHTLAQHPTQMLKLPLGLRFFSPRWLVSQPVWEILDLNYLLVEKNEIQPFKVISKSFSIRLWTVWCQKWSTRDQCTELHLISVIFTWEISFQLFTNFTQIDFQERESWKQCMKIGEWVKRTEQFTHLFTVESLSGLF